MTNWNDLLKRHPWIAFVAPLAVYLACGILEPPISPDLSARVAREPLVPSTVPTGFLPVLNYPAFYFLRLATTVVTVAACWPAYQGGFIPCHGGSWLLGILGGGLWIGVCSLRGEAAVCQAMGWAPVARPGFDPWTYFGDQTMMRTAFVGLRFAGLVGVVPFIEELFLRGFLVRYLTSESWWQLDLRRVGRPGLLAATAYGVLTHPGEMFAAALWFSLISWWMRRTGSLVDCVVAHAMTNLVLGLYVVVYSQWWLW